jgi:hypothetical protein
MRVRRNILADVSEPNQGENNIILRPMTGLGWRKEQHGRPLEIEVSLLIRPDRSPREQLACRAASPLGSLIEAPT